MPEIHLIIPDAALRAAIAEAVKFAGFNDVRETTDMVAALNAGDLSILILDESAADRKTLTAFQDSGTGGQKKRIFLLGDAEAAWKDYLSVESFPKPLRLGHLLSRLSFHLHTRSRLRNEAAVFGPWRFEPQKREIVRQGDGAVIRLTEKETALLDYLAQSDAPVSREELLAAVWGYDGRIDTHTLETHIYQLRRKLDPEGDGTSLLTNEQGRYRLVSPCDRGAPR